MNDNERIKEIDAEIKELSEKIKEARRKRSVLKKTDTIASLTKQTKYYYNVHRGLVKNDKCLMHDSDGWGSLKQCGIELFRGEHYPLKQTEMEHDEKVVAAAFIDEIIPIWNKYIEMIYGEEE